MRDDSWPAAGAGEHWVFGYGSLMWDPGFAFAEAAWGLLRGFHRQLCILSMRNRGTRERPGLALGLAPGGSCRGRVFRIDAAHLEVARAYLWQREMATNVYVPRRLRVRLDDGRSVEALVFIARRGHPACQFTLSDERAAELAATGVGSYGRAIDYLRNVVIHLDGFGITDGPLHRILALAEAGAGTARVSAAPPRTASE
ncbi:MAG: gamma-glutamylcyclotransferase [Rhodospirillales bacterium]